MALGMRLATVMVLGVLLCLPAFADELLVNTNTALSGGMRNNDAMPVFSNATLPLQGTINTGTYNSTTSGDFFSDSGNHNPLYAKEMGNNTATKKTLVLALDTKAPGVLLSLTRSEC